MNSPVSLNDNICPKHGRFIGSNCTYCDYPPLFPVREQSAEKEQKQSESSRAVTSDTLIALLEERKELFRKNADDFDRGVQAGLLEAISLIRKYAPSEISVDALGINHTVMALQAFIDYSKQHRMDGQPVWRELLANARVAIKAELSSAPKRESVAVLPYDVEIGPILYRKGVKFETLVNAAKRWYRQALETINLNPHPPLVIPKMDFTDEEIAKFSKPGKVITVEKYKPKNKEDFSAMLQEEYGYSKKLSDLLAGDVAGYGAFDPDIGESAP